MRAILFLLLFWPSLLNAGAWSRTPGEIYAFVSHEGGRDGWTGLYVERGGPGRLTFGLDIGGHVAGGLVPLMTGEGTSDDVDGRAMVFVRVPLIAAADRRWLSDWLMSAEFGAGADLETNFANGEPFNAKPRFRLGVSVGRGLTTPLGDGWTNIDLRYEGGGDTPRIGLDAVIGTRPIERVTVQMALFFEHEDDLTATFAPVVQYTLSKVGDISAGLAIKTGGTTMFTLGLARTF